MGVLIRFPVPARAAAAARIGRIFEPQLDLERAGQAGLRFFAWATAQTALVVGALQLLAA